MDNPADFPTSCSVLEFAGTCNLFPGKKQNTSSHEFAVPVILAPAQLHKIP